MPRSAPTPRWALLRLTLAASVVALGLAAPAAAQPAASSASLPDDALVGQQWQLRSPLDLPDAWARSSGAGVTVAVIDTGVDVSHPDLRDNLWTNPHEIAGNGTDDDGNGYADDVHGYDFASHSSAIADQNGHGTAVAGTIAARGGNQIGVTGVAPRARIMALQVSDGNGPAAGDAVAEAIRYAVANGALIVNLSLNSPDRSQAVEDAIAAAAARGVIVVASAGNQGLDLGRSPSYPVSYPEDNVLGVGALSRGGQVAPYSNTGPGVDILAPGDGIVSTAAGGGYEARSGTSLAAAEVSGTLALLAAARPGASGTDLAATLLSSARPVPGSDVRELDAGAALRAVIPQAPAAASAAAAPRVWLLRPRVSGHRVRRLILRWRQLAPGARVAAYRILVDGRTVARVSPRRRSLAIPLRTHRRQLSVRVIAVATAAARASASAVLRVFAP